MEKEGKGKRKRKTYGISLTRKIDMTLIIKFELCPLISPSIPLQLGLLFSRIRGLIILHLTPLRRSGRRSRNSEGNRPPLFHRRMEMTQDIGHSSISHLLGLVDLGGIHLGSVVRNNQSEEISARRGLALVRLKNSDLL